MTLARAGSVEWYGQARLQGIKNVAEGEEAEEVCAMGGLAGNGRTVMVPGGPEAEQSCLCFI